MSPENNSLTCFRHLCVHALVKYTVLLTGCKGTPDSGTHMVNGQDGKVGPSHLILETLVQSLKISVVRNVDFKNNVICIDVILISKQSLVYGLI